MIVQVQLKGQFGNQLFQYCACRYYAKQLKCPFYFPYEWLGKTLIGCDLGSLIDTEDKLILSGYFQKEYYIDKSLFYVNEISIPNIKFNEYCIIQFRGTDFLNTSNPMTKQYFVDAQRTMLSINPNLKFMVVTDDLDNAKRYIDADSYMSNSKEVDFVIMLKSKYLIIPNSTFGWWASYLNVNLIYCIGPSGWRVDNDRLLSTLQFNTLL